MLGTPLRDLARRSMITYNHMFITFLLSKCRIVLGNPLRVRSQHNNTFSSKFYQHVVLNYAWEPAAVQLKIAFFLQLLTIGPHFVRNCRIFVIAPAPPCLKREEREGRERERDRDRERQRETETERDRETERERKISKRSEDVRSAAIRCEDVRSADVRCEDVSSQLLF